MSLPLPLSSHELFRTHDVDQARELVAKVFCPHELMPIGAGRHLDARHHSTKLGEHVSLNYVQYGPAVSIEPGFLENFYLLQIPLRGRANIRCGEQTFVADSCVASLPSPTESLSMCWDNDTPHLIVQMSRTALEQHWERLSQNTRSAQPLVFQPHVALQQPELHALLEYIHYLFRVMDQQGGMGHPLLVEQSQQYLISSLLLLQPHTHSTSKGAVTCKDLLPRTVRRAKDFLHDHSARALCLADVCEHVGISARSLQTAFRAHFGVSPMAYLRDVRLDQVRMHLQSNDVNETSVTQVIQAHGFIHMGHFAAHYRRRFGERPLETLKRVGPR
ncbi:AraC family transcriptional regulator [Limnohabitans sp.]|uniref:AraC family transcriptional regulator n=1 Tax=Limnohabitans sp. TaxID=1907725 RepID=UPI00286EDE80|nr:AraC family transcriptional regulator [Limnohabitans sp.]